jgi:hypothetical protein
MRWVQSYASPVLPPRSWGLLLVLVLALSLVVLQKGPELHMVLLKQTDTGNGSLPSPGEGVPSDASGPLQGCHPQDFPSPSRQLSDAVASRALTRAYECLIKHVVSPYLVGRVEEFSYKYRALEGQGDSTACAGLVTDSQAQCWREKGRPAVSVVREHLYPALMASRASFKRGSYINSGRWVSPGQFCPLCICLSVTPAHAVCCMLKSVCDVCVDGGTASSESGSRGCGRALEASPSAQSSRTRLHTSRSGSHSTSTAGSSTFICS